MAELVYFSCGATSLGCAVLLFLSYRRVRTRLLLWSSLGFVGLAINNALLFLDLVIIPDGDLSLLRSSTALVALSTILFGLIWDSR